MKHRAQGARRAATLLAALLLAGTAPMGCRDAAPSPDAVAVRATFEAYRAAMLAKRGDDATRLVGPATLTYAADLLDLTRHANRPALSKRRIIDRIIVLAARAAFSTSELASFQPRTFLAAAITRGIGASDDAQRLDLGPVTVAGDSARASVVIDGAAASVQLHFVRDHGAWRFELVSLYDLVDDNLENLPKQLGRPVDAWTLDAVAATVGTPVAESIWDPPLAPSPAPASP